MIVNNQLPKVALIGGNGFIGNAIYKDFKRSNVQIIPTSRNISGMGKDYIKLDLFNENTWSDLLDGYKPNIIICTAWDTEHLKYWQNSTNFDFAKAINNFTNACFSADVNHFIGLGSCSEYGYSPGKCNSQTTPLNPQDPYSEAKVMASIELESASNNYGKKANWIRLFQPYGFKEKPQRLIPSLIANMYENRLIDIKTPNDALDFIHTDDVASLIRIIALGNYKYSLNIGTGTATNISDLALLLSDILKFPSEKLGFNDSGLHQKRILYVDPESEIFLGTWRPKYSLYDGLLSLIPRK